MGCLALLRRSAGGCGPFPERGLRLVQLLLELVRVDHGAAAGSMFCVLRAPRHRQGAQEDAGRCAGRAGCSDQRKGGGVIVAKKIEGTQFQDEHFSPGGEVWLRSCRFEIWSLAGVRAAVYKRPIAAGALIIVLVARTIVWPSRFASPRHHHGRPASVLHWGSGRSERQIRCS